MIPGTPTRAEGPSSFSEGGSCLLTPQSEEGPFYVHPHLLRREISEGRPGVPLRLRLRIVEMGSCTPLVGARVDVWQCDARGLYSGYRGQADDHAVDTTSQTFLRGTQMSDVSGWVDFDTIYPGWYEGRATHAHFKVFIDHRTVATGQVFFPDALSEFLYANVPAYAGRSYDRAVVNANDHVVNVSDPGRLGFCSIREDQDRYVATLTLCVDRSATRDEHHAGSPGPRAHGGGLKGSPPGPPPGGPPRLALKDRLSALVPGLRRKT